VPAAELAAHIKASGINVSLSTPDYSRHDFDALGIDGLVRVSPHAYNTTDEIDQLVAAVARA
jgi:cysteine desulfurase/selenocysteine lyase